VADRDLGAEAAWQGTKYPSPKLRPPSRLREMERRDKWCSDDGRRNNRGNVCRGHVAVYEVWPKRTKLQNVPDRVRHRCGGLERNASLVQRRAHRLRVATNDNNLVAPPSELGGDVAEASLDTCKVRRADQLEDAQWPTSCTDVIGWRHDTLAARSFEMAPAR
jgi:hypothetical protein